MAVWKMSCSFGICHPTKMVFHMRGWHVSIPPFPLPFSISVPPYQRRQLPNSLHIIIRGGTVESMTNRQQKYRQGGLHTRIWQADMSVASLCGNKSGPGLSRQQLTVGGVLAGEGGHQVAQAPANDRGVRCQRQGRKEGVCHPQRGRQHQLWKEHLPAGHRCQLPHSPGAHPCEHTLRFPFPTFSCCFLVDCNRSTCPPDGAGGTRFPYLKRICPLT
jgi:hypothetical protein